MVRELMVCVDCVYSSVWVIVGFFLQAEDGIRDLVRSRGLGDVYKRQEYPSPPADRWWADQSENLLC